MQSPYSIDMYSQPQQSQQHQHYQSPFTLGGVTLPVYNQTSFNKESFGVQSSYPYQQAEQRQSLPQLQVSAPLESPPSEYVDTPRTLYKSSPMTEVGDDDLVINDGDDEYSGDFGGGSRRMGLSPPQTLNRLPFWPAVAPSPTTSPSAFTLGDLPSPTSALGEGMTQFSQRLNNDIKSIKSASLFPSTLAVKTPVRKPSMHLSEPPQPINPFERPSHRDVSPIRPFDAPVINRVHLRRYQQLTKPVEECISMKDLVLPNSQFIGGYDPELLAAELTSPSVVLRDIDFDPYVSFTPSTAAVAGTKRPAETFTAEDSDDQDSAYTDSEDEEDAVGEDDGGEYKAPRHVVATATTVVEQPVAKRPRFEASSTPEPPRRQVQQANTPKPRTRHLQPHLVRTNGCLHGCKLLFSTPYESRRHQEDAHGREEAYALIASASATLVPKDYRFLIQIALHAAADKWDSKTRSTITEAAKPENENNGLKDDAKEVLVKFAKEWSKRYECPRCGTSFSRLDSKKRHFEKQCR